MPPPRLQSSSPHPIDRHVGARLREARERMGLSRDRLARQLGVTATQIQKYETGATRVSASRLHELAGALDETVDFFFVGLTRDPRPDAEKPLPDEREARRLIDLFRAIRDPLVRDKVAGLVKSLAANYRRR